MPPIFIGDNSAAKVRLSNASDRAVKKMNIIGYSEIKESAVLLYWRACRDHGFSGWTPEQVCSWVREEFEGAYDLPMEKLMNEVANFVLTGGWYDRLVEFRRKEISRMLSEIDLNSSLSLLSPEDADEFVTDLQILNFLTP